MRLDDSISDKLSLARIVEQSQWLYRFSRNVTSQHGEDGIIQKILEIIDDNNGWCVEFGASDGISLSNTYNLIQNKHYSAVLIEGRADRFDKLLENYRDNKKVIPIHSYIGFDEKDNLDYLLRSTEIPTDFDLLSIDIDGNDYHVWEAVKEYKPKVVVIEYNLSIPNSVEFIQARDKRVAQGSSLLSIDKLAKQKGYELVAVTKSNGIFVDSKYYDLFDIEDNSIEVMRTDDSDITYIFSGYDGTVFIRGYGRIRWHRFPYVESKMQQMPKWLREHPNNYGRIKRFLIRVYRNLRRRKVI